MQVQCSLADHACAVQKASVFFICSTLFSKQGLVHVFPPVVKVLEARMTCPSILVQFVVHINQSAACMHTHEGFYPLCSVYMYAYTCVLNWE